MLVDEIGGMASEIGFAVGLPRCLDGLPVEQHRARRHWREPPGAWIDRERRTSQPMLFPTLEWEWEVRDHRQPTMIRNRLVRGDPVGPVRLPEFPTVL